MGFYKNEKGITIIALIVTIIVLLILTGISIALISGNESIMEMAKKARENMNNAEQVENETINNYNNYIDKIVDGKKNTYNVTCYDVLNDVNGLKLGEHTWQAESQTIVSGEQMGNDKADNIYYTGYFYLNSTQETVSNSDVVVYRFFSELKKYLLKDGETQGEWSEYYQNHTTGSLTSYVGYKSFKTGSSYKYSNYHKTYLIDLTPYSTVNIYGNINTTNASSGHFYISSLPTTTGVPSGEGNSRWDKEIYTIRNDTKNLYN